MTTTTALDFQGTIDAWRAGRISTTDLVRAATTDETRAIAERVQAEAETAHTAAVTRAEQARDAVVTARQQVGPLVEQLAAAITAATSGLDPATRSRLAAAIPDVRALFPRLHDALDAAPEALAQAVADSTPTDRAPLDPFVAFQQEVPTVAHRDVLARLFQLAEESAARGVDLAEPIAAVRAVVRPLRACLG